jgi:predicted lipid-binding transport protein (Tim44 family)
MRTSIAWLLSGGAVLCGGRCAWAQAGRFIPRSIPGGGGGRFLPHVPVHFFGQNTDVGTVIFFVIVLALAAGVLAWAGYQMGWALGGGARRLKEQSGGQRVQFSADLWQQLRGKGAPLDAGTTGPATGPGSAAYGPEHRDLILTPLEVAAKAAQTTRLMEFLAHSDPLLEPACLRALATATFCQVQQCWEARDYGPVRDLLGPRVLAEHEELLRQMRKGHEINRIEGLRVEAVDFVHLFCPEEPDGQKVTALITFEAAVYFVDDRDGSPTRGSHLPGLFQEFWVFHRQGERWLLDAIERTHASDLLQAANHVAGLSAEQLENVQHSIAL